MIKNLICIECPKGCHLTLEVDEHHIIKVSGNQCAKGEKYAALELENPVRILTSVVLTEGLSIKMIPVRTDKPIPKDRLLDAMNEIKKLRIKGSVKLGENIVTNFLDLKVNLVATRDCLK